MSATVRRNPDGQLVLDDPDALAVVRAVKKYNCRGTIEANADRVKHFVRRMRELGASPHELVIVVLNVDDQNGALVADILMPGHDWQAYRDRGEIPFARGLAARPAMQEILDVLDGEAADKLRAAVGATRAIVLDHGVAEVFGPEDWR